MLRCHVGFAGIPPFSPGGIPADSNGIPAGISAESHLGSQIKFQYECFDWQWPTVMK